MKDIINKMLAASIAISIGLPFIAHAQRVVETVVVRSDHLEEDWGRFNPSPWLRSQIRRLAGESTMSLSVPILLGVRPQDIRDSFGEPRPNYRRHEGIDIFAPRGAFIVSPTDAVVSTVGVGQLGGNYVFTVNPGGERFYYAHLDSFAPGISVGTRLQPGDLIGYVGNTGATNTPPHLHFGIYRGGIAVNPYPRMTQQFSTAERIDSLNRIFARLPNPAATARAVVAQNRNFFNNLYADNVNLPSAIKEVINPNLIVPAIAPVPVPNTVPPGLTQATRDLQFGSRGADVIWLQRLLISANKGAGARSLRNTGATGYFGARTRSALTEYQRSAGISPARGYYGPRTRAYLRITGALR